MLRQETAEDMMFQSPLPKCCHRQLQERGEYSQPHKEGKSPQRQRWESAAGRGKDGISP